MIVLVESNNSSSAQAQRNRILEQLRLGPKTSYELRRVGCYQSAARILELRRSGYVIETILVNLVDRDGYEHPRCALYQLINEPSTGVDNDI